MINQWKQPGQPCSAQRSEEVSSANKCSRKLGNQNLGIMHIIRALQGHKKNALQFLTLTLVPVLLQLANPTRWSLLPSSVLYFNDNTVS